MLLPEIEKRVTGMAICSNGVDAQNRWNSAYTGRESIGAHPSPAHVHTLRNGPILIRALADARIFNRNWSPEIASAQ